MHNDGLYIVNIFQTHYSLNKGMKSIRFFFFNNQYIQTYFLVAICFGNIWKFIRYFLIIKECLNCSTTNLDLLDDVL